MRSPKACGGLHGVCVQRGGVQGTAAATPKGSGEVALFFGASIGLAAAEAFRASVGEWVDSVDGRFGHGLLVRDRCNHPRKRFSESGRAWVSCDWVTACAPHRAPW